MFSLLSFFIWTNIFLLSDVNEIELSSKLAIICWILFSIPEILYSLKLPLSSNSILIPLNELQFRLAELENYKTDKIVVYCRVGNRSQVATELLIKEGFKATNLLGGIVDWTGPIKL